MIISLIVVALGTCSTAAQPEPALPGDILILVSGEPNAPVSPAGEDPNQTWDPAKHLAADWESIAVSMTSRLYNPASGRNADAEGPQWSLSMMTTIYLTDANGLIGWSWLPTSVLALDPEGRVVASSKTGGSLVHSYSQPVARRAGARAYKPFSLSVPIDPNAIYVDFLSRVEWTMNVLLAEKVMTVDIPFETSETWVELTPGMEILLEQATVGEGTYHYRIQVRYDASQVDYVMGGTHLWRDNLPPATAVLKMDVLNAEGQSIADLGDGAFTSPSSSSGSINQITGTSSGSGTCSACGDAAIFRYTLAFGVYEQEVRLAVENVPVPEF